MKIEDIEVGEFYMVWIHHVKAEIPCIVLRIGNSTATVKTEMFDKSKQKVVSREFEVGATQIKWKIPK